MKTMKKNGMTKVKIIEFFADSPIDMILLASSDGVSDGRYKDAVKFILAVTFVAFDLNMYGFVTFTFISSCSSLEEMYTGLVKLSCISNLWFVNATIYQSTSSGSIG